MVVETICRPQMAAHLKYTPRLEEGQKALTRSQQHAFAKPSFATYAVVAGRNVRANSGTTTV